MTCKTSPPTPAGGRAEDLTMKATSLSEAWRLADEVFPTDYEKDEVASARAGYSVYRSTADGHSYDYICELGDRLEVNLSDGSTVNIWIDSECEAPENVSNAEYSELKNSAGTRELSDGEAVDLVALYFGFSPEKVVIVRDVPVFANAGRGLLRKNGTKSRAPLYNASDWNYIRFDCVGWSYEVCNGVLRGFVE